MTVDSARGPPQASLLAAPGRARGAAGVLKLKPDEPDPIDVPDARPVPSELPFWGKEVTLGELRGATIRFAKSKRGKSWLLEHREGAVIFAAWTGDWSTDIFAVTEADVATFFEQDRLEKERQLDTRRANAETKRQRNGGG